MARIIYLLALVVASFIGGWLLGCRALPEPVVETRVDTVFYPRPVAREVVSRPVTVNVPRMLFAPDKAANKPTPPPSEITADSVGVTTTDSVAMQVAIETCIYEDSTYRAQVSGPVVGPLAPSLDWVEVYARTQTRTVTRRHRFAVTAGVGAAWTPRGIQPTAGVQVGVVLWGF